MNVTVPYASCQTERVGRDEGRVSAWSNIYNSIPKHRTIHSIDLDVTEGCNLACVYCFKWQKKAVHMTEETAKRSVDWLLVSSGGYRGELKVNLMGGEPLLRFDLIQKIVPYGKLRARQYGKRIHFGCTTNCTHLTDEMMDFWRLYGMGFHCSIDGIPEIQNANRPFLGGGGSAHAVERNVPKILAYRPTVMARATVSPRSVGALYESVKYLVGLGFQAITFRTAANCDWAPADFEVMRQQYSKLGTFYVDSLVAGKHISIEELTQGIRSLHSMKQNSRFPCGAGHGLALVDPRGDIWPCHRFGPHQCGGAFCLGKLGEPFNDRLRDVFLNYNVLEDVRTDCKTCRAAITCRTWCYAECVESTGTFYDPGRNYCQAAQVVHDEVLHVHDRLRSYHPELLARVVLSG